MLRSPRLHSFRALPACLAGLSLAACLGSPDAAMRRNVPREEDRFARAQLQAIASGKPEVVEQALDPGLQTPQVKELLARMSGLFAGERIEAIELIGYQWMDSAGTRKQNLSYQLRLSGGWAVANVASRHEAGRRVIEATSVNLIPEPLEKTHAFRLRGKSALHYAFLALAVAVPLFMLYAVFLIFRMPLRKRWLWVLACLVGVGQWSLNWTSGETAFIPFNLQLLGSGMLRMSSYTPWILSVALPLGALWVAFKYHRGDWRREAAAPGPVPGRDTPAAVPQQT